jgi:hypothetical protein
MKTMQARYPGYCTRTGARILPGDLIDYHGKGRSILRARAGASARPDLDAPDIRPTDVGVSDHIVIGGQSYYRNRNGRCEDAPCCGCCTI